VEVGRVAYNRRLAEGLFEIGIAAPGIAHAVMPGQFVHVRLPGMEGHILRRPFSVFAVDQGMALSLVYQVRGCGSGHMSSIAPGTELGLLGPLGRGWRCPPETRRALLVGGGVGAAPLFLLASALTQQGVLLDVILGAQSAGAQVCLARFERLAALSATTRIALATDDGSLGRAGLVTPLVEEALQGGLFEGARLQGVSPGGIHPGMAHREGGQPQEAGKGPTPYGYIAACGPEPMMRAVATLAAQTDALCEVSLERHMACGIGACLSCVVETAQGLRRSCVDGPAFNAREVLS
jgi:dihydroorotate dehydrogenase electron transfer subunit